MKRISLIIGIALFVCIAVGWFFRDRWTGLRPVVLPSPADIADLIPSTLPSSPSLPAPVFREPVNTTNIPLRLPEGLGISIFAKNLTTPRVMAFDAQGNLWVSEMNAGAITRIEIQEGVVRRQDRIYRNLKRPHGIAFDPAAPSTLYIAEEHKISRSFISTDAGLEKVIDLPGGGGHFTRTIGFGPDGLLYVAIGSSCDVCHEKDERRAALYVLQKDGSDFARYAKGLRNTVFFTWHPVTGELWGTDMGRDRLGDDLPPDEINIIKEGGNYGWPICYGKNIHDTAFDRNTYVRNPCMTPFETPSHIDIAAHSAPLGLAFVPSDADWPQEYADDLLVAYHGSWNRSEPTGYKVVRMRLDREGNYEGVEDFISGWITKGSALGRPVGLVFDASGNLYISDDKAGVIYKVEPRR